MPIVNSRFFESPRRVFKTANNVLEGIRNLPTLGDRRSVSNLEEEVKTIWNMMTTASVLSTLYLLIVSTSTSVVPDQPTLSTTEKINATDHPCLNDPNSLPRGVIILDTRNYSSVNTTRPVTAGSDYHYTGYCAEANIRRQPGARSRLRRATREKRSDCTNGIYGNKRMCDYNPDRIPAEIDMVDCGRCNTIGGVSVRLARCRKNGKNGFWRPKTINLFLPFRTATGVYEPRNQEIAVGCHCDTIPHSS